MLRCLTRVLREKSIQFFTFSLIIDPFWIKAQESAAVSSDFICCRKKQAMESEPLSPASRKPRGSQPRGSVSSIIQATPELQTVQSLHLEEMKIEAEAFHGEMGRAQIDFTSDVLGKESVNDVIELTRSWSTLLTRRQRTSCCATPSRCDSTF